MAKDGLSPKQRIFIQEYLVDKNAARSAKSAGYAARTARSAGARLLTNVDIAAAVAAGLAAQAKRADLSADKVLQELALIAFADFSKGENCSGKIRALELLGKHFGLFSDKVEVDHKGSGPQVILTLPDNGFSADSPMSKPFGLN